MRENVHGRFPTKIVRPFPSRTCLVASHLIIMKVPLLFVALALTLPAGGAPSQLRVVYLGKAGTPAPKHCAALMRELGREADKLMLPMQPGDVLTTFADIDDLTREVGFRPETSIEVGVRAFVAWYRDHYGI